MKQFRMLDRMATGEKILVNLKAMETATEFIHHNGAKCCTIVLPHAEETVRQSLDEIHQMTQEAEGE